MKHHKNNRSERLIEIQLIDGPLDGMRVSVRQLLKALPLPFDHEVVEMASQKFSTLTPEGRNMAMRAAERQDQVNENPKRIATYVQEGDTDSTIYRFHTSTRR